MMDGRVKTLHPKVLGGLLAIRENPAHEAAMLAPGIAAFLAWPVLGHVPTGTEAAGLLIAVTGLLITVTAGRTIRPD